MVRSQTDRLSEKTVERQFLYELEADFELTPATPCGSSKLSYPWNLVVLGSQVRLIGSRREVGVCPPRAVRRREVAAASRTELRARVRLFVDPPAVPLPPPFLPLN